MANKDYYGILGVDKSASADDIKSAYRRLAKKYHPDVYATKSDAEKKEAEEKFKDISHAYEVLSDADKKAAYDQYGDENGPQFTGGSGGFGGFGGGSYSGFEDIFSNIFGGGFSSSTRGGSSSNDRDGDDIEIQVNLTFDEAVFGCEKEITFSRIEKCSHCKGTGAKDNAGYKTCPKCGGSGAININQRTIFGVMQSRQVCPDCGGSGKIVTDPCPDCGGKGRVKKRTTLKVKFPAGMDSGKTLTKPHEGHAGKGRGANGNLFLICNVAPSPMFERKGYDVYLDLPVSIFDAVLGKKLSIPSLKGMIEFNLPEGTPNGKVFRFAGKGVKVINKEQYGDMYVTITVDIPKSLTSKQKKAFEELASSMNGVRQDRIEKYNKILKNMK